jgi:hypothetical protein
MLCFRWIMSALIGCWPISTDRKSIIGRRPFSKSTSTFSSGTGSSTIRDSSGTEEVLGRWGFHPQRRIGGAVGAWPHRGRGPWGLCCWGLRCWGLRCWGLRPQLLWMAPLAPGRISAEGAFHTSAEGAFHTSAEGAFHTSAEGAFHTSAEGAFHTSAEGAFHTSALYQTKNRPRPGVRAAAVRRRVRRRPLRRPAGGRSGDGVRRGRGWSR